MLISLVGLSGSGKGFISRMLTNYSDKIIHLDIDTIGHLSHKDEQIKKQLIAAFGEVIVEENQINRKKLASIVFNSQTKMNLLEDITWSFMENYIDTFIKDHPDKIIILDWLLLPKTKYFEQSDLKVLITASPTTRLARVKERDNITEEKFWEREQAAPLLDESQFDYIIQNENIEKTKKEVENIYEKSIIHR